MTTSFKDIDGVLVGQYSQPVPETDPRVTVEKMDSIPVGDNPFNHDLGSMGTTLVRDILIMHPGYDSKENPKPIGWIYIVNTRTGNRVKISLDDSF